MDYSEPFDEQFKHATSIFKALAHPIRVAILSLMKTSEPLSVSEIHDRLSIPQAVASHHLIILKNNGVLYSKKEGKNVFYLLKHPLLGQILDCIENSRYNQNDSDV